jgi:hypothetical protein
MKRKGTLRLCKWGTNVVPLLTIMLTLMSLNSSGQQEIIFSQEFTQGTNSSSICTEWNNFRAQLTPEKNYKSVLIKGSRNEEGLLLEDPVAVATIANAIHTNTGFSLVSQGQTWNGFISVGFYLAANSATNTSGGNCTDNATNYALRPCITNNNWGGINGPSCGAESQRIDLVFSYGGIQEIENIPATCPETSDGSLTVMMNGGVAPYTFEWSNGETNSTVETISGYTLLGHFEDKSYFRSNDQIATLEAAQQEAEEYFGHIVSINSAEENAWLLANGFQAGDNLGGSDAAQEGVWVWASSEPFSYTNWSTGEPNNGGGAQNNIQMYADGKWDDVAWAHSANTRHVIEVASVSTISNLAPGEYTVTVTDAEGNILSKTLAVGPDPIEIAFDMTQTTTCDETGDGTATANVTGGNAPYTYSWDSGEDTQAISNKAFGTYQVTVTDDNGCNPAVASVEITADDNTLPTVQVQNIEVYLDADGEASIVADEIDNGSSDDCAIQGKSIDVSQFSCEDIGSEPLFDGNTVIDFDGIDDRLDFDQLIPYSSNHTIATWIKMSASETGAIFTWGSPTVNNYTYFFVQSGRIRYISGNGAPAPPSVAGTTFIGDNQWHHVAATRNSSGDVNLYIDGNLEASGNLVPHVNNPTETTIGVGLINGAYQLPLDAQLDEFAYWTEELTVADIEAIQCSGVQGAEVFLDFEEGAGTTNVTDESGNGNSATLINMDATGDWVAFGEPKVLPSCPPGKKVTLTVTDAGGNSASADAYVMVNDTITPIAAARSQVIELDENGNALANADNFDDGSTDNCAIESFSLNKTSFDCEDLGQNDVVLTVTDIHGNERSVGTAVTVEDNLAPTLAVQNVQVSLSAAGTASISIEDVEIFSSDNCGIVSKSLNLENFSCEDVGEPVLVEMTVTDASGNEKTESFSVTVLDEIAPVANPSNYTVALDENGIFEFDSEKVAENIGGADTDNCGIIMPGSHSLSQMQFSCEELGENTVTYSVEDMSGNEGTASVTITVVDETAPQAVAQNLVVELNDEGFATISADDADNGSTDNCSIALREISISEFSCEDLGEHEVTLTVADGSENTSQATFTVTVVDQVAPVIAESLSLAVYLDENGEAIFDTEPLLAQASDNCGLDAIVAEMEGEGDYMDINGFPFSCDEVGVSEGPLYVRDQSGNLTPFTLQLSILDTIKPSFDLGIIELQLDADGNAELTEEMLAPYASDNCGIAEVAIQVEEYDCSMAQETQFTEVIVFDTHGNAKQQTLIVMLKDEVAPIVEVEDITLEISADGMVNLSSEALNMTIIENCSAVEFNLSQSVFSCENLGINPASITVADAAGNTGSAEFNVTVVDAQAPDITGPQVMDICEGTVISYESVQTVDNCSAELSVVAGPQAGDVPSAGEYMVEFEAVDPSGNTTTHILMVNVSAPAEVDLGEDLEVTEGTQVTLTAGEDNENTYLWSDGSTSPELEITATEDMTISVEVTTPEGCSSTDEITISIADPLGIADEAGEENISLYPNPTRGAFQVEFSMTENAEDVRVSIMDISGKVVNQKQLPLVMNGDVINLDITDMAEGLYLINIVSEKLRITERIVKQ